MLDTEKIIEGLEKCKRYECDDCTEKGASQASWDCPAYDNFVDNALTLLKEQEPMKPMKMAVDYVRKEPVVFSYECPVCMCGLLRHWVACPICGRAVKWDATD